MTEQREGMTELGEGKTELDKLIQAAQVVIDSAKPVLGMVSVLVSEDAIQALRQAVEQAKGVSVEPVAEKYTCDYCGSDYTSRKYCCDARRKYLNAHGDFEPNTTPPSIDALIAQAIEKHDEKMTVIKTVNTRKIAQPYIDALIAEIEAVGVNNHMAIQAIIEKYRSVK